MAMPSTNRMADMSPEERAAVLQKVKDLMLQALRRETLRGRKAPNDDVSAPGVSKPVSPSASAPPLFTVSSYDNSSMYGDDDGPAIVGKFMFPGVALWAARTVVDKSLSHLLAERISRGKPAPTADELFSDWLDFGDAAYISGPPNEPPIPFSSTAYAREQSAKMCGPGREV
jgi:hypothetical protein